jgi:predicted metal-dependent HD superfamily phosphohydrolase
MSDQERNAFALDRDRFTRFWTALGARHAEAFEALRTAYAGDGRYYHSVEHILECLAYFDRVRETAHHPDELEAAIWFHDAVYDVSRHDNEARSAQLVRDEAERAGIPAASAERIAELVLGTSHRAKARESDARLLADIDLSILGASPERYRRYEADIRREYAVIPEELYRQGRLRVLDSFLERTAIYQTPYFYDRLERQARENLAEAAAALHGYLRKATVE